MYPEVPNNANVAIARSRDSAAGVAASISRNRDVEEADPPW